MSDYFDLDKLERLEREATPGPWEPETWCGEYDPGWCGVGPLCLPSGEEDPGDDGPESPCAARAETDAALIAALRNAAPALIAELRAARKRIAELEEHISALECIAKAKGGAAVVESKSAEEIALGMLWDERHRAKFYRQYAQSVAYEADCAASVFDRMSLRSAANRWHQVSSDHRRNVSTIARIIRAIREERRLSRRGESEHYTSRGEVNGS